MSWMPESGTNGSGFGPHNALMPNRSNMRATNLVSTSSPRSVRCLCALVADNLQAILFREDQTLLSPDPLLCRSWQTFESPQPQQRIGYSPSGRNYASCTPLGRQISTRWRFAQPWGYISLQCSPRLRKSADRYSVKSRIVCLEPRIRC
jgi:hypothetical protein